MFQTFSILSRVVAAGSFGNWLLTTPPELMAYQVQTVIYDAQHLTSLIQARVPDVTNAFMPVIQQFASLFV